MSGKPAARKGDPTADGDANPIDSGSPDVLFDGLPAAREGDTTECGSELCDKLSSTVLINGKAAVMVDSEGTVGNVVMSGSGTVLIGDVFNKQLRAQTPGGMGTNNFYDTSTYSIAEAAPFISNYRIHLKNSSNRTLTPLAIPNFKEIGSKKSKNSELVEFTITNKTDFIDRVQLEIVDGDTVLYTEDNTARLASRGAHKWTWDGYSSSGILDTNTLKSDKLKVRLIAFMGNQHHKSEFKLIGIPIEVNWIDATITRKTHNNSLKTLNAEVTIRASFTDGGNSGTNAEIQPTPYSVLQAWAREGVEHYWSRDSTRASGVANSVSTPKGACQVTVKVDLFNHPRASNFPLINNLSVDPGRSTSLGGFRKIYHNLGYAFSEFNARHAEFYARESFKETSAHELGHLILNAYGGKTSYSWRHKGTSTLATQKPLPDNPAPTSGEIDLMHYHSKYYTNQENTLSRTAAADQDVASLLWLTRLKFKVQRIEP